MRTKEVSIKLTEGMSTKTNEQLAAKLKLLQNATLDKLQTPKKRNGFTSASSSVIPSGSISSNISTDNYIGGLVIQDKIGFCTYDEGTDRFSNKSSVPVATLETTRLLSSNKGETVDRVDYTEFNGYKIITQKITGSLPRITVINSKNQNIFSYTFGSSSNIKPIVFNSKLYILRITATNIYYSELTFTSGVSISAETSLIAGTITPPFFDVIAISSSILCVAYFDGSTLKVRTFNGSFVLQNSYNDGLSSVNTANIYLKYDSANDRIWCAYWTTNAGNYLAGTLRFTTGLGVSASFATAFTIATALVNPMSVVVDNVSSTQATLFCDYKLSGLGVVKDFTMNPISGNTWSAISTSLCAGALIVSRPWVYNGKVSVMVARLESATAGVGADYVNSCLYVADSRTSVHCRSFLGRTKFNFDTSAEYLISPNVSGNTISTLVVESNVVQALSREAITADTITHFKLTYEGIEKSKSVNLANCLYIAGALPTVFDGNIVYEMGLNHSPAFGVFAVGAGGMPAGSYRYVATYEFINAKGQLVVTSSEQYSFTSTGNFPNVNIVTYKIGSLVSSVKICLYRTEKDGDTFYKIGEVYNDPSFFQATINDTVQDANLVNNQIYYFPDGVLENFPPDPFNAFCLAKNRLFAISADRENYVQYTKEKDFDLDPGFNEFLRIIIEDNSVSTGEKLKAVYDIDDKIVFFKESTTLYSIGDGPDNSGENGEFSRPQMLSYDVGCINPRCISLAPNGMMFKSKKGIYSLTRGMQISYIGSEVEAYNDYSFSSSILDEKRNLVYFTTSDGPTIVYDYFNEQWSVFDNYSAQDICMVSDKIIHGKSSGLINIENSNYDDNSDFIPMKWQSNWIKVSGIQNFGRIKRLLFLGKFISKHKFKISIAYDYEYYWQDSYTLTPEDSSNYNITTKPINGDLYNGTIDGVYQWKIHLLKQKCESIMILIEDIDDGIDGESFQLSDITAEVGLKDGPFKTQYKKQG